MPPPKRRRKLQAESFSDDPPPGSAHAPDDPGPDVANDPPPGSAHAPDDPEPDVAATTLRTMQARITVQDSFLLASGSSLLPLPMLDALAVTAIQIRMMKKLADLYGVPFSMGQGKWLIRSLGSYAANTTSLLGAASLGKLFPGVGTLLSLTSMPVVAGAFTYALGSVLIGHFAAAGSMEDLDPLEHRVEFQREFRRASAR